jgi:hypothetical protein
MTPELPLSGGCACGAVRYEIDAAPITAGFCHCTRCQHRTGNSGGASVTIVPGSLRIVAGEEHLSAWKPESGFHKVFCSICGCGVWAADPDGSVPRAVRMGTLDSDPGVRPEYHSWTDSASPWAPVPDDGLTRYPGARPMP